MTKSILILAAVGLTLLFIDQWSGGAIVQGLFQ